MNVFHIYLQGWEGVQFCLIYHCVFHHLSLCTQVKHEMTSNVYKICCPCLKKGPKNPVVIRPTSYTLLLAHLYLTQKGWLSLSPSFCNISFPWENKTHHSSVLFILFYFLPDTVLLCLHYLWFRAFPPKKKAVFLPSPQDSAFLTLIFLIKKG